MRRTAVAVGLLALAGTIADRAPAQTPTGGVELCRERIPDAARARSRSREARRRDIASRATIKVLTTSGFTSCAGDNGFVCLVMRGWAADVHARRPARSRL